LNVFVGKFNTTVSLDERCIVRKLNRFYLLNENLKRLISEEFFYVGTYLGKLKNERFFPSFTLLSMIAERKANKITVDEKSEWLFICGRDIFKRGILKIQGSMGNGDYTLVLNHYGECLGFGKILHDPDEEKDEQRVMVKNISDIGDFLRREK